MGLMNSLKKIIGKKDATASDGRFMDSDSVHWPQGQDGVPGSVSTSSLEPEPATPTPMKPKSSLVKLKSTEVKRFSGRAEGWTGWKLHTECCLMTTGLAPILRSRVYAAEHADDNKVVHA